MITDDIKSLSKGKLKVTAQDDIINNSGELRRVRTLSFKMKLSAKYFGYKLTQWQKMLTLKYNNLLEWCQIVYKPPESENVMLLHYGFFCT